MPTSKKSKAKGHAKSKSSSPSSSTVSSTASNASAETTIPAHMSEERRRRFLNQMVQTLPAPMQNRVTYLKNLQVEYLKIRAECDREVLDLEAKYAKLREPLLAKRKDILTGEVEPVKELPKWKPEQIGDSVEVKAFKPLIELVKLSANCKGIPNFWVAVFFCTRLIESVKQSDEPALKKLTDIRCVYGPQQSFTLEFHFDKNEYFSNEVLTKQYFRKCSVDKDYPFGYNGPEITHCKGCKIKWAQGKNLTVKTLRKREGGRALIKHIKTDSFFRFFEVPSVSLDEIDSDEETIGVLTKDFKLGDFYRSDIIPKAFLYFCGEICDVAYENEKEDKREGSDMSGAESENESAGDGDKGSIKDIVKATSEDTNKGFFQEDAKCTVGQ